MKLVVVTREEPVYLPTYLGPFLDRHAASVGGALLVTRTPPHHRLGNFHRVAGTLGTLKHAARHFRARLGGGVQRLLARHGVPVWPVADANAPSAHARIREAAPDLLVLLGCPQRLTPETLSLPPAGGINIHGSLLPDYRGIWTAFWVLADGRTETGVTVHRVTPEVDAGEILAQTRIPVAPAETIDSLYRKIARTGSGLLADTIDRLAAGTVESRPQHGGFRRGIPDREAIRRFRAAGRRFG